MTGILEGIIPDASILPRSTISACHFGCAGHSDLITFRNIESKRLEMK
jgi:hypothetical protein